MAKAKEEDLEVTPDMDGDITEIGAQTHRVQLRRNSNPPLVGRSNSSCMDRKLGRPQPIVRY